MILKLHVEIESHPDTRWLADAEDLAAKSKSLIESVVKCWSTGPEPRVTIIPDEVFWTEPDPETTVRTELNWSHLKRPLPQE